MSSARRPFPSLLAPLVLVLALPADRPARDETAFGPAPHTILTKTYREETRLEVDSLEVRIDGRPIEQDLPEAVLRIARRVVFSDEYARVEERRIRDLTRTFEHLGGEVSLAVDVGEREEHQVALESELADAVVRFEWDADREEYVRSFEEGGTGDDEHLAALELDADLVGFLPEGPVEVDDTWEVDPVHLGRVFAPGGDLRLLAADLGREPYVMLDREAMIAALQIALGEVADPWDGEVHARYAGSGADGGVELGTIALEFTVSSEADQLERLRRAMEHLGLGAGEELTDLTLTWRVEGTGELEWNLERGLVHAFRCEADVTLEVQMAQTQPAGEAEVAIEMFYELSGSSRIELSVE